jgi:hypothetical protein
VSGQLFQTSNHDLAALVCYLYGGCDEVCHRIEIGERGRATFFLLAPEGDAKTLQDELFRDEVTVQLHSFQKVDSRLRFFIREAKRSGDVWEYAKWSANQVG